MLSAVYSGRRPRCQVPGGVPGALPWGGAMLPAEHPMWGPPLVAPEWEPTCLALCPPQVKGCQTQVLAHWLACRTRAQDL